jgi:hypothetical protein
VTFRLLALVAIPLVLIGCALRKPIEQRTTQGPSAEQFWFYRMILANGREPTFDERRHWQNDLDDVIARYLREHPEAANSLEVTTFRFERRASVGMSKQQVMILLGPPESTTTDPAEMAKLARRHWPAIQLRAKEAWTYPLGWRFYFGGDRVVDITQYLRPQD